MATKLSSRFLPELLSWLHHSLPSSFTLYQELRSHLRGKFPDLNFYVDRWPDPQAAATVIDPTGEQLKGRQFYKDRVLGVFGVTEKAQALVLRDERVVDWSNSVIFNDVPPQTFSVINALAKEMGAGFYTEPCYLFTARKDDLLYIPVPDGMKTSAISEEDVNLVTSTWKYSKEGAVGYIKHQVQHFPSVVLKSNSGEHIGHVLGQTCGNLGLLYVLPQFRRRGYGKALVSQLAHKYFLMGEDVYAAVEETNHASMRLNESIGLKAMPGGRMYWIMCSPVSH